MTALAEHVSGTLRLMLITKHTRTFRPSLKTRPSRRVYLGQPRPCSTTHHACHTAVVLLGYRVAAIGHSRCWKFIVISLLGKAITDLTTETYIYARLQHGHAPDYIYTMPRRIRSYAPPISTGSNLSGSVQSLPARPPRGRGRFPTERHNLQYSTNYACTSILLLLSWCAQWSTYHAVRGSSYEHGHVASAAVLGVEHGGTDHMA